MGLHAQPRARVGGLCAAGSVLALLATSGPAVAAPTPISGTLNKPGYTLIALASNGRASVVRANRGRFTLRPRARRVTLHLRAPNGVYAGPIVVGSRRRGRRAVVGVRAGARLGRVRVRRGYARPSRRLRKRSVETRRWARARRGVPIGAGNFGFVRSKPRRGAVPGDLDLDGIPNPLDVDDDGDRVLDNLGRSTAGGGARAAQGCGPNNFYCQTISSYLALANFEQTVNVNAGSTAEQIDTALSSIGYLRFSPASDSAELDCGGEPDPNNPDGWIGGLSYCTRGGTGIASGGGPGPPFPGPPGGQFDPDGDGFGTFPKPSFIAHRATTPQIKTGDVLTQRVTSDGTETQIPATLNFVFVTVPALVSYSDTKEPTPNSATVSYPVPPGGPGTFGNGFPVSAPAGQDVVVTLTFWRPQRQSIPESDPPAAQWMDIGHLTYAVGTPPAAGGGCPQASFSTTDPNLAPPALPLLGFGGLADQKDDEVSSSGNTLSYKLNLSQCLASKGLSFNPGEERMLTFLAVAGATDTAQQTVSFKRE